MCYDGSNMSELQQYYDAFSDSLKRGEGLKPEECRCQGVGGWILSDVDTWHKCPDHYAGQRHPEEDYDPADDMSSHDDYTAPPKPGGTPSFADRILFPAPLPTDTPEDDDIPF
jgi:hypothetical protein